MVAKLFLLIAFATLSSGQVKFESTRPSKIYLYNHHVMKYEDAINYCDQLNASLVMIRSQLEQNWIYDNLKPDSFWLGVRVMDKSVPTHFIDGSKITWFNWAINQPNFNANYSWSIAIWDQKWFTRRTGAKFGDYSQVVCEQKTISKEEINEILVNVTNSVKSNSVKLNVIESKLDAVQCSQNTTNYMTDEVNAAVPETLIANAVNEIKSFVKEDTTLFETLISDLRNEQKINKLLTEELSKLRDKIRDFELEKSIRDNQPQVVNHDLGSQMKTLNCKGVNPVCETNCTRDCAESAIALLTWHDHNSTDVVTCCTKTCVCKS